MQSKILKVNQNKSASGSTSSRIVLPAQWVRELGIETNIIAEFDGEKIILRVAK